MSNDIIEKLRNIEPGQRVVYQRTTKDKPHPAPSIMRVARELYDEGRAVLTRKRHGVDCYDYIAIGSRS